MNKYKKKDCYNYMPPFNDGASDSEENAKNVRKTGEPKNYIQLKEIKGLYGSQSDYGLSTLLGTHYYRWRNDTIHRKRYSW